MRILIDVGRYAAESTVWWEAGMGQKLMIPTVQVKKGKNKTSTKTLRKRSRYSAGGKTKIPKQPL